MSHWSQHGSYALHWQGDVLMAVYGGAWNEIAAKNLHRAALALWQERSKQGLNKRWGLLSDARGWEGGTPEALEAWWAFFADGVNHGMVAVTDVLPSRFHASMVRSLAERAEQIAPYRNSASVEEGLAWLAQQGLDIKPAI